MCFICERNKGSLLDTVCSFLGAGIVSHERDGNEHGSWEKLVIWKDGKKLTLTADGDPGGRASYFHWELDGAE